MKNNLNHKIKVTISVVGTDWRNFKEKARNERTTPSILVSQMIHKYLMDNE